MGMEYEANMDGFIEMVLGVFPNAVIGEDADGQLVIHTNLTQNSDGVIVDMDAVQ